MITRNSTGTRCGFAVLLLYAATALPQLSLADSITFAAPTITLHESGSVQTGYFDILITNSADGNTTGGLGDTPLAESQGYGPGVTNTNGSDVITGFNVEVTTTGAVTFLNADDQTQAAAVNGPYNYLYSTDSVFDSPFGSTPTAGNLIFGPQDIAFSDVPTDLGPTLTAGTPRGLMRVEYSIPANYAGTVPLIIVPPTDPSANFGSAWSDTAYNLNAPLIVNGSLNVTPEPSSWILAGMSLCICWHSAAAGPRATPFGRRTTRGRRSALVPPRMGFSQVSLGFAAVILLLATQSHAAGLGDINSATDTVGVDQTGALYDGTTGVGFLRNSDSFDPLAPGTPRDSWGVSAGTVSGQADPYRCCFRRN